MECSRCHRANLGGMEHSDNMGEACSGIPRAPHMPCVADHADLVSGISTKWSELDFIGVQEVPAIGDGLGENAGYRLQLANCTCGSTLARKL